MSVEEFKMALWITGLFAVIFGLVCGLVLKYIPELKQNRIPKFPEFPKFPDMPEMPDMSFVENNRRYELAMLLILYGHMVNLDRREDLPEDVKSDVHNTIMSIRRWCASVVGT